MKPSNNDLKRTSRTKKYADDHQKYLKTHLGAPTRLPPARPNRKLTGTHKHKRNLQLFYRLREEGWL